MRRPFLTIYTQGKTSLTEIGNSNALLVSLSNIALTAGVLPQKKECSFLFTELTRLSANNCELVAKSSAEVLKQRSVSLPNSRRNPLGRKRHNLRPRLDLTNETFVDDKKRSKAFVSDGQELRFRNVRAKIDDQPVRVVVPEIEAPKQPRPTWMPAFPLFIAAPNVDRATPTLLPANSANRQTTPALLCHLLRRLPPLQNQNRKDSSGAVRFKKMLRKLDHFFVAKR